MSEWRFVIKDMASRNHYKIHNERERWWIFNEEGEGVEVDFDSLYSIVDKYFKENMYSFKSCSGKNCSHKEEV